MALLDVNNLYNQDYPDDWRTKISTPTAGGVSGYDMTYACYCGLGRESALSNVAYVDAEKAYQTHEQDPDVNIVPDFTTSYDVSDFTFAICRNPSSFGGTYEGQPNAFICNLESENSKLINTYPALQRVTPPPIKPNLQANGLYESWSLNWTPVTRFMFRDIILVIYVTATSNLDNTNSTYFTLDEYISNRTQSHPYITSVEVCPYINIPDTYTDDPAEFENWTNRWLTFPNTGVPFTDLYGGTPGNTYCGITHLNSTGIEFNQINWSMNFQAMATSTSGKNYFRILGNLLSTTPNKTTLYLSGNNDDIDIGQAYLPFALTSKWGLHFANVINQHRLTYRAFREYDETFEEEAMSQAACFGMFFMRKTPTTTQDLKSSDVYMGILRDGIGHGEYTNRLNDKKKAFQWDGRSDGTNYTPGGGGGGGGTPSYPDTNPIYSLTPGVTLAGKGTQCYAITYADIEEIMSDIFGRTSSGYEDLLDKLGMFGANPMNAFVSLKWYPFTFSGQNNSPVVLGSAVVNSNHVYIRISGTNDSLKQFSGSCKVQVDNNFINSRRTKAQLFLPFYGFYELPMNLIISQPVNIEFSYNVPDELGVWIISFGSKIYDFVECDPSIEVPLTGDNAAQIALNKRNTAISIAKTAGGLALSLITGAWSAYNLSAAVGGGAAAGLGMSQLASQGMMDTAAMANYGMQAANLVGGLAASGGVATAINAAANIRNTVNQAKLTNGSLSVNVPTHSAAGATTFLNLPMDPFIILYTPDTIEDFSSGEYKLKTGIACDKWTTLDNMPANSLLATAGLANMNTSGMELSEVQELNSILQSGFYK